MRIGAINQYSEEDFPGRKAAVVYTQGCNLRCPYCRNPELVDPRCFCAPADEESFFDFLDEQKGILDAVVVSGGEPTVHRDLPEFIKRIRERGFAVKLHTNGTNPEMLRTLLSDNLVDYIAMDVKAPLNNYIQIAGSRVQGEWIRTSIWIVRNSGVPHEFCTTVVPGLHTVRELKAIGDLLHGADKYVVQDFISDNPMRADLRGRPTFARKPLRDLRTYMERRVKEYEIRNSEDAKQMPVGRRRPPPIPEYVLLNE